MRRGLWTLPLFAAAAIAVGTSCNPYDLLVHDRFEQADFNSKVDILWVVDNSGSMQEVQLEVAANLNSFISNFGNLEGGLGTLDYDTIGDAVTAWAEFQNNKEAFLDFHMGVTTTDLTNAGNGNQGNIRSAGAVGSGGGCQTPEILTGEDARNGNIAADFSDLVDVGVAGTGNETGLRAAAFAMCKGQDQAFWDALPSLPDDNPVKVLCGALLAVPATERFCNQGFFRDGAATVVIIVTDEGDDTYRSGEYPPGQWVDDCVLDHNDDPFFGECDCRLEWMMDFFSSMPNRTVFANIGPTWQASSVEVPWCDGSVLSFDGPCNPFGADVCAIDFYQQAACLTGGLFTPIEVTTTPDEPASCEVANFQQALTDIGALISNLAGGWRLSTVPDVDTIKVFVGGEPVPPAAESPSGGWRYAPANRAVVFSGDQQPTFNEIVDIYYKPAFDRGSAVGRPLPF